MTNEQFKEIMEFLNEIRDKTYVTNTNCGHLREESISQGQAIIDIGERLKSIEKAIVKLQN